MMLMMSVVTCMAPKKAAAAAKTRVRGKRKQVPGKDEPEEIIEEAPESSSSSSKTKGKAAAKSKAKGEKSLDASSYNTLYNRMHHAQQRKKAEVREEGAAARCMGICRP